MYITRNIENTINRMTNNFKVLLLIGAKQVGKTTLLRHLADGTERKYVTLDDPMVRSLALEDPALFLQRYNPPVLIDGIQCAPTLLNYIEAYIDLHNEKSSIWLTSSQRFSFLEDFIEKLADRVGVVDLYGLSLNEINSRDNSPFLPVYENLLHRSKNTKKSGLKEIYKTIWQGSMPAIYNNSNIEWQTYYASYMQQLLQYDIMKVLQVNDEMLFFRFLCAAASQTGSIVNYAELAKAAEISAPTAKQWVKTLESVGIIYMLRPFILPGAKYIVKAPKLYFCDTGLAAYLTCWNTYESLENGAMSEKFFITWITMEILKSYSNEGELPPIYYLRNFNGKEIELIIYKNGIVYPIAIKKSVNPIKSIKTFNILEPVSKDANIDIGPGAIVCFNEKIVPITANISYVPAGII